MPRKKSSRTRAQALSAETALARAALQLAAKKDWAALTLPSISRAAKIPSARVPASVKDKNDLLPLIAAYFDAAMRKGGPPEGANVREKLFELIMRRFDAAHPHRAALQNIARALLPPTPARLIKLRPSITRTLKTLQAEAGMETQTLRAGLERAGLAAVLLYVLRAFVRDDTPDLARTLAATDRALSWAETASKAVFLGEFRPGFFPR